jgi:hypothetical protein
MKTKQVPARYNKILIGVLGIFILISMLLSFNKVADFVAGLFEADPMKKSLLALRIADTAKTLLVVGVGLVLVTTAVSLIALPVVAASLAIVGLGMVVYGVMQLFQKDDSSVKQ